MNILIISFLAIASLSTFPTKTFGSTDLTQKDEPSVGGGAAAAAAVAQPALPAGVPVVPQLHSGVEEIWQEDDREVLIRNERGAKNNNNNNPGGVTNAGKKGINLGSQNKLTKKQKNSNSQTQQGGSKFI